LLAPEIVGHPEIKSHILSFLSRLTRLPDLKSVYLLGSQKINDGEITCIQMLQVLGLVEAINEYLYISHQQYMELVSYIGEIPFRSEEDLWFSLRETNLRARAAEIFVLKYEQDRLKSEGRNDLSNLVKRVSENNVNAGYDIRSFNSDGSTRYIEVKSAKSLKIQFYLSAAERRFAENNINEFWIYFIPRTQDLPNLQHGPIMLTDFSHLLEEGFLSTEPTTYRVRIQGNIYDISDPRIINCSKT